jgi:hypothetical protein
MMLGIIAYGSLINRQETEAQMAAPEYIIPIRLEGFKRSFNQRPAWRKSTGKHCAVLNAQRSRQGWLNAVCYCYSNFDFTALDIRERGYSRTSVEPDQINHYPEHKMAKIENIFIYLGKKEYENEILLPNPDYLNTCLVGAQGWGEKFFCDFLDTTHINNGILLRDYVHNS